MIMILGLAITLLGTPILWRERQRSRMLGSLLALGFGSIGIWIVLQYQADGLLLGSVAGLLAGGFLGRVYQVTRRPIR